MAALTLPNSSLRAEPAPRGGGRIVFGFGESGSLHPGQLAVMDGDGRNRRLLPLDHVYGLSWSPDGRFVAYNGGSTVDSSRSANGDPSIWTMRIDGPPRRQRVVRDGGDPDWSPKGDAIAFERGRVYCSRSCDIWVVDLNDRRQRRVVRDGHFPRWSPNGRKLLFLRGRARTDLWVLDLAAKKERRLVRKGDQADWSGDGRQIVFERCGLHFECSIYVVRSDGTKRRRLFRGESPVWSPNGQQIAFIGGTSDVIMRARLDGSRRRTILSGVKPIYCPCWAPDWGRAPRARR